MMRNLMKRCLSLACAVVMLCSVAVTAAAADVTAKPTTQKLYMMKDDGTTTEQVVKDFPIYNINYNNYMKIRDVGYLLDFQVEYNSEWQAVSIITNQHSDGVQVSTDKAVSQQTAKPAWSKLYIDGKEVSGLTMYNIAGNNYIKIRDIANAVGFGCCYSGELKAIVLSPFYGYSKNDVMTEGGRRTVAYGDGQSNLTFGRSDLWAGAAATPTTPSTDTTTASTEKTYKTGDTLTLKKGATYNVEVGVYEKVYINYGELDGSNNTDWVEYDRNQSSASGKRVAWIAWDQDIGKSTIEGLAPGSVQIQCLSTADYKTVFAYINVTVIDDGTSDDDRDIDNSQTAEFTKEVVRLVNVERAKEGLAPLTTIPELTEAAQIRVKELPQAYSHNRPDGRSCFTVLDEAGISHYAAGENIAVGRGTPEAVVEAWMNSPGHRANILNKNFTAIGVGHIFKRNGTNSNRWWVQLFIGQSSNSGTNTTTGPDVPETTMPDTQSSSSADFVNEVVRLVNVERAKEGLPALTTMSELTAAAQVRAEELPQVYSHTRPDGRDCYTALKEAGVTYYTAAGENIAAGYFTPEAVVEGWMNSPGHRGNILNKSYTTIGVGYTKVDSGYRCYWAQMFIGT